MEIENFRILLSALIAALPTVMSLGLIALFAFPRNSGGHILNTSVFNRSIKKLYLLITSFSCAIFINIAALANLEEGNTIYVALFILGIVLSFISFIGMPLFLIWYLKEINKL